MIVEGVEEKPTVAKSGSTKEDREMMRSWQKDDQIAKGLIAVNVQDGKQEVTESSSSKEAWDKLVKLHDRQGLSMLIMLKMMLFKYERKKGMDIGTQVGEIRELCRKLDYLGRKVSDEDKVVILLGSVDTRYTTAVTSIQAAWDKTKIDTEISFDNVVEALLNEEVRLGRQGSTEDVKPNLGALAAKSSWPGSYQGSYQGGQNQGGNGQRLCWVCDEEGHIKRHCPVVEAGKEALRVKKEASKANSAIEFYM